MAFGLLKTGYNPLSRLSNSLCLNRPKTILTGLFLIGVSGWVIHRATGLNVLKILPFSGMGDKALRLFRQIFSSSQKPTSKSDAPQAEKSETPKTAIISDQTSIEQLLQLVIFKECQFDSENPQNQEIEKRLANTIHHEFTQHAKNGEEQVAKALIPLFASVKNDPDRFVILVTLVIFKSQYCPRFTANVLEKIEWPSESLKQEKLPNCLAFYIASSCIELQDHSIEIESHDLDQKSTFFPTVKLLVNTKRILGYKDFVSNPEPLSSFLTQGLGIAIQLRAQDTMAQLKKDHENGNVDKTTKIGLNLFIGQFMECRFPASMIAPVLLYLKNISGLVGLEILDVGGGFNTGNAFKDEDAPALLEIFRTNPHLFHIKINVDGMTPEKQETFLKEWQDIMTSRKKDLLLKIF